ncbi:hypothetical protein [Pedobacter antarcticus]|uniref:hypothetical protein n=1 Tax=Pedobacter antarcticus TaxID=34086 RepID=UPI00292E5B90|nr:hypothetical protein [Pedobacter antarcticus]
MKSKPVSLPKKIKSMKPNNMIGIPADKIQGALPILNKLSFPISREYQNGSLIITRTA